MSYSSYKQYKEDTRAFTTWLGHDARTCGYKLAPRHANSQRDTNQRPLRNTLKPNMTYEVTTLDLENQIEIVATSDRKPTMPAGIRMTLRRAIEARRLVSEWYETVQPEEAARDGGGHKCFNRILQDALVRPQSEVTSGNKKGKQKSQPTDPITTESE
jgi:hypothetical protein